MIPSEFEMRLRWLERRGPLQSRRLDQVDTLAASTGFWIEAIRDQPEQDGGTAAFLGCPCSIPLKDLSLTWKHLSRTIFAGNPYNIVCNPTPDETVTQTLFYTPGPVPFWISNCFSLGGSGPIYRAIFSCRGAEFSASVSYWSPAIGNGNCANRTGSSTPIDSTLTGNFNTDNITVRWSLDHCTSDPFYVRFNTTCNSYVPAGANMGYAEIIETP